MSLHNPKFALIIGHPGHELRIYRFLEIYRPRVYVITDGSGSSQKSRIQNTLKTIIHAGAIASPVMGRFTDKELYNIIREKNKEPLIHLLDDIISDMEIHKINAFAGDALEGYNPTHDLCRYMINAINRIFGLKTGKEIPNFEFSLDGPPHKSPGRSIGEPIQLDLNEEDLGRKFVAAHNYPELLEEVKKVLELYGKSPFRTEYLWPVEHPDDYQSWIMDKPFYETWGKQKVNSGTYKDLITYQGHLKPLAEFLTSHSNAYKLPT